MSTVVRPLSAAGAAALLAATPAFAGGAGLSLRFMGNGLDAPGLDRVEIALDPHVPADVGAGSFTVEWWMKALPGANTTSGTCTPGDFNWIFGNIVLDRDVFGPGDWGDWGVSLWTGVIAFGVGGSIGGVFDHTVCGTSTLDDGVWHHVAATRRASDGRLQLYVDGVLEAQALGPTRDVSYRDGRSTPWPKDPFLVLGTEKHDVQHTPFAGWLDELRLSTVLRYTANFTPPAAPFVPDASTAALYHFDEGSGTAILDGSGTPGGPSHGVRLFGGDPPGPVYSADTPFLEVVFADGFESGDTTNWSFSVG